VIDTATNTEVTRISVGTGPFGVAVTPGGAFVYVTNDGSNNVSVINTATNTEVDVDGNPGNGITRIPAGSACVPGCGGKSILRYRGSNIPSTIAL